MPQTTDVAIIGGGVIGCSIAFQLSKMGMGCTVFERSAFASGASGATAGIVGPLWYLDRQVEANFALGLRSLEMFPGLAAELREAGIDPEFRQNGILKLALGSEEVELLRDSFAWQGELGYGVTWLDPDDVLEREPEVNPSVMAGVYSPKEGSIRGQRYVEALVHAASRRGGTFLENTEVAGLEVQGQRVTGVRTENEVYHAGHTVLAAGPWTGTADRWLPQKLPVRPVKGQRVLLRKTGFVPKCPVSRLGGSIIPQVDGNIMAAATREEGEFNERVTAEGVSQMLAVAAVSFPTLKDAAFVGARAGVRPGSPDEVPIMGPLPDWEGLSIASGHDHVGIILSPGTGELMANYIATGDSSPLEPFSITRFDKE